MPYVPPSLPTPPFMPPPAYPMPPMQPWGPPPPHRSTARALFRTAVLVMLALSLIFNVMLLAGSALSGNASTAARTSLSDGDADQTIAVIPVTGVIMENTAERFSKLLGQAEKNPAVKAVVIEVDTPGGAVTASDQMYHRIDAFKSAHPSTPVVVSMGGLATSGGYYLSCRADYIFAQPTTMTGNIGVIMPRYNFSELAGRWGIKEATVTAPKVGFKNAGSMFAPETEQDKAYFQDLIDGAFTRFKQVVNTGRAAQLKAKGKTVDQIADGRVFLANDALAAGLVDQIGFPEDAWAYAAKAAGLNRPNVVKYRDPPTLMDLFGASDSKFPASPAKGSTTVNGLNVNLDARGLEELTTPRALYLWQGQ